MKRVYSLIVLLSFLKIAGQETKTVSSTGSAYISGKVSPDEAKKEALNDAKLNALRAAGISEQVSTYNLLFSAQKNNDFKQFFNSSTQSEIQGAIKTYSITSEKTIQKNENELVIEIKINAEVIKYKTQKDPSFDVKIEGINAVYTSGQKLNFEINCTKNCFVTIFNIVDGKTCLVLCPQKSKPVFELGANKKYNFPIDFDKENDYELETDKKNESNQIICVFTKTKIDFIQADKEGNTDFETMLTWIYNIPPDQRKVDYQSFFILPKK